MHPVSTTHTGPSTFSHQDSLPKLPIPDLNDTCAKYLQIVSPLLSPAALLDTQVSVSAFLEKDGPELQDKLQKYAQDKSSYIESFWNDAYLKADASVVLNLNPFFVLEDDPTPSRKNQIARTSSLIVSSAKFIKALRSETLEPDVWRNIPLCMHQFHSLFGCSRVPTLENLRDTVVVDPNSQHIVVLSRGQFYWFDIIWEDGNLAITERELSERLRSIQEESNILSDAEMARSAVGVLSTDIRRSWAQYRQDLLKDNKEAIHVIDTALFLVCLDDTSPPSPSEFASTFLHGTYKIVNGIQTGSCINRWYDKLQIIVCENGVAGVNFEHSTIDGHTALRFVSDVFADTIIRFAQTIRGCSSLFESTYLSPKGNASGKCPRGKRPDIHARKLEWILTPAVLSGIRYAESKISDLINQNEVKVLEFSGYGKNVITKHNLSPDAFIQMAIVASYYSLYGKCVNTYEPALTKKFLHGRTEAVRSMTAEASAFVKTFCSDAEPLRKILSLRAAVTAQVKMVKESAAGKGIDRHLYALKCIWEMQSENQDSSSVLPTIFSDVGWKALNDTTLSTSNCGNPALRLFGFGPVVSDGFGIGYIIKEEGLQFCVASKHRQTQRFLDTLETYLFEVQELLNMEESVLYPNLTGSGQRDLLRRSISSLAITGTSSSGYGFFDSGDSPEKRVGRKLG